MYMAFHVYILSDKKGSRFIVGMTNNLVRQVHEMRNMQQGFYAAQQVNRLVYFESHKDYNEAKRREREMLLWDDNYMKQIISMQNGKFDDLFSRIF